MYRTKLQPSHPVGARLSLAALVSSLAVGILIYILVIFGMSIKYLYTSIKIGEPFSHISWTLLAKLLGLLKYFNWVEFRFSLFPSKFHRVDLRLRFIGFRRFWDAALICVDVPFDLGESHS